jgi:hypothetical protein
MNKTILLTALALAGWLGVGAWSVTILLEPASLIDILRLFSLC